MSPLNIHTHNHYNNIITLKSNLNICNLLIQNSPEQTAS